MRGIGRTWTPTEGGRQGCVILLVAGLTVITVVLLIGAVVAALR